MDTVGDISVVLLVCMIVFIVLSELLRNRPFFKVLWVIAFCVYIFLNLSETLLFRSRSPEMQYQLHLFLSYRYAFSGSTMALTGDLLNILLYVPFGFLLCDVNALNRHPYRIVLLGCAASLCTELAQLVLHLGCFESDDIFNNTLGCAVGVGCFYALRYIVRKGLKGKRKGR